MLMILPELFTMVMVSWMGIFAVVRSSALSVKAGVPGNLYLEKDRRRSMLFETLLAALLMPHGQVWLSFAPRQTGALDGEKIDDS